MKKKLLILTAFILGVFASNAQCDYTINGYDSYGDGWNGNNVGVTLDGVAVPGSPFAVSGSSGIFNIAVDADQQIELTWSIGYFNYEASYDLLDSDGNIVHAHATNSPAGVDYTGTTTCPSCTAPSGLTAFNITQTSVDISWFDAGALSANVEYGVTGFPQGFGLTIPGTTNTTETISGLTYETTYDFYVQANCGGSTSTWTGPYSFHTGYCIPAPVSVDAEGITNVTIGDINHTTTTETENYGNYSYLQTDVQQSVSIDLSVTVTYNYNVFAWVDWNNDLDFDDVGETYYIGDYSTTETVSIYVPATANLGFHRLRIGGADTGLGTTIPSDPCYSGMYGSFEDYTLNVTDPPTCLPASTLTVSNITTSSAVLSWNDAATSGLANVEYGVTGFAHGDGTIISETATTTESISGLDPNTTYDFYVQSICGGGDFSAWAGPNDFYTGYCTPAPSSVDAEGIINVTIETINNTTTTEIGNYGDYTSIETDVQRSISIDLSVTVTYAYNVFAWIDWNNDLDFDDTDEAYYIGDYSTTETVSILVPTTASLGHHRLRVGGADSGLGTITPSHPCYTGPYGSFEDYTINVTAAPTCLPPTEITSNVTNTSVDLTWTDVTASGSFNFEYGVSGFTQNTGTMTSGTNTTESISGLDPNTTYDFYVQSNCGGGDFSAWTVPFSFTTLCDEVTSFPYTENFDGALFPADVWSCWKVNNNDAGFTWSQSDQYISPHSGSYAAHGMGNNDDYLISPAFTVGSAPIRVKFWDNVENSSYNNTYTVKVSTTGTNTTDFTDSITTIDCENTSWVEHTVNLLAYTNQTIYVAFHQTYTAANNFGFGIDDFTAEEIPTVYSNTDDICNSITVTSVSGTDWISFTNANGIIGAINPNGNDLGDVELNVIQYSTVPSALWTDGTNSAALKYLPRYWNIESANTFTTNVDVRFYLNQSELDVLNAFGTVTNYGMGDTDLDLFHYDGPNENCDQSDNDYTTGTETEMAFTTTSYLGSSYFIETSVSSFSEFGIGGGGMPLPVELIAFNGSSEERYNKLDWSTASETNNDYFYIEKSIDGIHYNKIGEVKGNGNSTSIKAYSFNDFEINSVLVYYKLTQVDFNGTKKELGTLKLTREVNTVFSYPNPANDELNFTFNATYDGDIIIEYIDIQGKSISENVTINANSSFKSTIFQTLSSGIYFTKISENGTIIQNMKIVKL